MRFVYNNEVIMITFLNTINSKENSSYKVNYSPPKTEDTLISQHFCFLHGPYTIPFDIIKKYLTTHDNFDTSSLNLSSLGDILKSFDIKSVIKNSRSAHAIHTDEDALKKQYDNFHLESKMEFPYRIDLYTSNHIISFLNNIKSTITHLNYAAFVTTSKCEIDSIITECKALLKYEFRLSGFCNCGPAFFNVGNTVEDIVFLIFNPFSINLYTNDKTNNPFYKVDDYILCLKYPHKYKLQNLEPLKGTFKTSDNLLYANFIEGGLENLQRKVLTYKANEIIFLYLICLYLIYLMVEYVLQFTDELHNVAYFIYSEMEEGNIKEPEVYIPLSIHEHFRYIDFSMSSHEYSSEADNSMKVSMKENMRIDQIDENYKQKWAKLQKTYIKIFKVGISKLISKANSFFFKKYYGRIPHLYKQYSRRAIVVENTMVGDPGEILSTRAVKYIERMANDATKLFDQLLQIARRITSVTNIEEKINIINSFCKKFKIDKENPDSIANSILNETYYHIALSILQDNEIYGFTVDGIMQNKKFPPANHIVTSLFVENPHEKPRELSVADIFSSEKGILLFAHPEQLIKFNNLYRQSASKIIDTFNPKIASVTEKNMATAARRFANQVRNQDTSEMNSMHEVDPKEQKKISDKIDKALIKAIDMIISQKRRCLQCSGIAHDMIVRVTDLAKRCVVSMLEVEKSVTDVKSGNKTFYNSGISPQSNKRINKQLERNKQHIENKSNNNLY
jgi:hypothetical protein